MATKTEQKQRQAIPLFLLGKTDAEVAEAIGVSRQTIWKWKRHYDLDHKITEAGEQLLANHRVAIAELVGEAIGAMSDLLHSDDENLKFKSALTVLESAMDWERPRAPGHDTADNEILEERIEATRMIERAKRKFEKEGGDPSDTEAFFKWSILGTKGDNGGAPESAEDKPKEPGGAAPRKTDK